MRGKSIKKSTKTKVKNLSVSDKDKKQAIVDSIKFSEINRQVDQVLSWINQELKKLAENPNHKNFLSLDFIYSDDAESKLKKTVVDTILRLLGTRLLTDDERIDLSRPPSTGLQATNRPNLYIYYEHRRPDESGPIQERYTLFVSKDMKLPAVLAPQKIEEVSLEKPTQKSLPPEEIEPEVSKQKRTPGIFETINKIFLGEDEEY